MAISLIIRLLSATQKMAIFARLNGCLDLSGMFFGTKDIQLLTGGSGWLLNIYESIFIL